MSRMTDYSSIELSDLRKLHTLYSLQRDRMIFVGATLRIEFEQVKDRIISFEIEIEQRLLKEVPDRV